MRSRSADDRGSVTAEFAVAMPAVLLVLATALGGVQLSGLQLRLQDAAADAARMLGRGDDLAAVASRVGRQVPGAVLASRAVDDLVCARLSATPEGMVGLIGLSVSAVGCALADGG